MTTRGNGNTRSEALRGIQKLSRSKFEHNKKLPEFDSILYKCRQFNKQEKRTLSFTHISKTGNHITTEILPKNALLPVDECELQIQGFDCFTNNKKSMCHIGVLIYTKKCLKAVAGSFSKLHYQEYVYCKLSSKNSGLLHILCIYRSPNSTIENNNNLNSLISEFSKLNGHLLILGDFNYPTKNWATLGTLHNKQNCATKFLTVTRNCFLHQHVNNPTHVRPNQTPTLIDLIFTSDDHAITTCHFVTIRQTPS